MQPTNETKTGADDETIHGPFPSAWHAMGDPQADAMVAKGELVRALRASIQAAGLTQREAALRLKLPASNLSRLLSGRFRAVTFDQLFRLLAVMGHGVRVVVAPDPAPSLTVETPTLPCLPGSDTVAASKAG